MNNSFYNFKVTATMLDGEKIEIFNYEHDFTNWKFRYEDIEVGELYCYQTFKKNGGIWFEGDYDKNIPLIDTNDCKHIFKGELSDNMKKVLELNDIDINSIAKINTFEELEIPYIVHKYKRYVFKPGQDDTYQVNPLWVKLDDFLLARPE